MAQFKRSAWFILASLFISCQSGDESSISLLTRLASPEFEGRGVGTQGLEKAQSYLVQELTAQGFQPQLQSFRVFVGNTLGENNRLENASSKDFVPYAFSKSGRIDRASASFVGFGITYKENGQTLYDDYEGIDVQGKVVIALLGDPATGSKSSVFRNPANFQYSTPIYKVQNAALHGAAGIILVQDPLALHGPEPELEFEGRQGGGAAMGVLAVQARLQLIQSLFPELDLSLWRHSMIQNQKPASFDLANSLSLSVDLKRQLGDVNNIIVTLPGIDPSVSHEYIAIGAHYDHLGFGGDSSMEPHSKGYVHSGADDNASGVQAVFDTLIRLKKERKNRHPVVGIFFSAEEIGLLGSRRFVENTELPEDSKIVAMLNLDMVGRMLKNRLSAIAVGSAEEFAPILDSANQKAQLDLVRGSDGLGSSDHASFLEMKIPSLFFTTGAQPDYHRPSDTADKINIKGLHRVEAFVHDVLLGIDALEKSPVFSSSFALADSRPGRGYGVYFGSIPDFTQDVAGVKLQGTRPGSPADQAGLQAGDVLTQMGEVKIGNLYDLVFALRFYRPGDVVMIEWSRKGETLKAETTLKFRG